MRLFVYGTLKRAHRRHELLGSNEFVGTARTRPVYRLYDLGQYPALIRAADGPAIEGGLAIEGELWEIDDDRLKALDRYEGCEQGLYRREAVDLEAPHDVVRAETYIYLLDVGGLRDCGTCW